MGKEKYEKQTVWVFLQWQLDSALSIILSFPHFICHLGYSQLSLATLHCETESKPI